jgi:Fic-DOC domain mobile mystery protein B
MKFEYAPGATPLDPDETAGLIPLHITTQVELNEWEAQNILNAEKWLFSTKSQSDFLTIEFIKLLHNKMFGETWEWGGLLRSTEKNIGVAPYNISTDLKNLLEDVRYQILSIKVSNDCVIDEVAYRFHHRLVEIHPFPNGNGRHSRLMTDFLLVQAGRPRFTWGDKNLASNNPMRDQYLNALRKADNHDYTELAAFVRS